MMINCPKCNLLQPKDQYCAQCGVNMETWSPPVKPFWKKILRNWMVQLSLLFILILVVVMWDNFSGRKSQIEESSLPPVANEIQRNDSVRFAEPERSQAQPRLSNTNPEESSNQPETTQLQVQRPTPTPQERNDLALQRTITVKLMSITPAAVENLIQVGRRIDEGIYVISNQNDFIFRNKKNINGLGSTIQKNFEFGTPVELFYGEVDQESGLGLGFYTQVTISEGSDAESINAEVRFWHQLKLSDDPSSPLYFELNFQKQNGVVVVDPSVHDVPFTPEELALYDSSRKLSVLNDEAFFENLSDIAILLNIQ